MITNTLKIYDEEYEVEWDYEPASGDNFNEPWTPESVDIISIDGNPPLRYTFHTIKTLEMAAIERTHELIEDAKAERIIDARQD